MTVKGTLFTNGTAANYVAPNTLGTPNPYGASFQGRGFINPAWTQQGLKFVAMIDPARVQKNALIPVQFIPSSLTATYTVTVWIWNRVANVWAQPKDNASFSLQGPISTFIENASEDPMYFQINTLSAGTLAVYFDDGVALAA